MNTRLIISETQSNYFYGATAVGVGGSICADALPGHIRARGVGEPDGALRGESPGGTLFESDYCFK